MVLVDRFDSASFMLLWQRLDRPGHDFVRLERPDVPHGGWRLSGTSLVTDAGRPCCLEYEVVGDAGWRTRAATVCGWIGLQRVDVRLDVDETGGWRRDGRFQPQTAGCIDVDLGFTPATNTLPIRRLSLAVGQSAPVRAAWLRFPELTFEVLEQVYTRTAVDTYRYESRGGAFTATLTVNRDGLVTRYGSIWSVEASREP